MPPLAETAIGVDVGGTHVRAARIGPGGDILASLAEPTDPTRTGFSAQLVRMAEALRNTETTCIGVGLPGRIDGAGQRILSAGYLDIAGLDVPGLLRAATGLGARIENDATMALAAEARDRPATGVFCMVTIGTGIGGAIRAGGRPWHGGGCAGQFGHIAVSGDGPRCKCGRTGCVETFSSGTALARLLADWPAGTRAEDLLDRAEAGDAAAEAVLVAWAAPLERALHSVVAVANPDRIVIGGGLGAAMVRAWARLPGGSDWYPLPIVPARLGDRAGVIGAGLVALEARA
ncbi:MAG: glucokinase Glk [Rhodobacteraceae bacterium HLUCCA08]|nr:MAG: glucokinase Glk [Rhodobacteraceae bacterium HLUCCA08]